MHLSRQLSAVGQVAHGCLEVQPSPVALEVRRCQEAQAGPGPPLESKALAQVSELVERALARLLPVLP